MKYLIKICALICMQWVVAQSSQPFQPWSISQQVPEIRKTTYLPEVEIATLLKEDERNENFGPYRFGYEHILNADFFSNATTDIVGQGTIYRQVFESTGALALRFIFYPFHIPDGVNVYAYNSDMSQIEGAYTSDNNHVSRYFSTPLIIGDQLILEINIPNGVSIPDIQLQIEMIVHDYKGILLNIDRDRDCGMNVMCEEADPYENQINAVSYIDDGSGLCSGAMINNVEQDLTPYYFTAAHCTHNRNPNIFRFYFNYYVDGCESGSSPYGDYAYTSTIIADCECITGSGNDMVLTGPDFTLLEITDDISIDWEVFYAGWNRENPNQMPLSAGVHHPFGEPKKINFDSGYATSTSWDGPANTHWFFSWDEGGTQSGSSGSPLYDDEGRIVGTLTGGVGECEEPGSNEYYGKFSLAWDWGDNSGTRLKDWLDPNNTQITYIDGTYLPVSDVVLGDPTGDGLVNINDLILIVQFIQGTIEPIFPQNVASDLNSDGIINIQDIILTINIILN